MPRQVRVEYAGATEHARCRGNRREAIDTDDDDWRRRLATFSKTGSDEAGETWHFEYKSRGEVKAGEKKLGTSAVPGMKRGYQYDAIGNRTEARVNGLDNNWFANALNQITSRNVEGKQFLTGKAALPPALLTVTAQTDPAPSAPIRV